MFYRYRNLSSARFRDAELGQSDGTRAGTLVRELRPGPLPSNPLFLLSNKNGVIYFEAEDGRAGRQIWKSDGTEGAGSIRGHIADTFLDK